MTDRSAPFDYDVGPHGISGHYDAMLERLRKATPKAVVALAAWAWVPSWPPDVAIFNIGPVLTLGLLVKIALAAWTIWVSAPLVVAVWHLTKWRALEERGLQTVVRNDYRLRVISYRVSDDTLILDQTTEQQRRVREHAMTHSSLAAIWASVRRAAVGLAVFLAVPVGFWLLPRLTGHGFRSLTQPPNLAAMVRSDVAHGDLRTAHWLARTDVQGVFGPLSVEGVTMWLVFFLVAAPRLSDLVWSVSDYAARAIGNQFIPGARVLDKVIPEKTIDWLREQKVHGGSGEPPLGDAARRMSE